MSLGLPRSANPPWRVPRYAGSGYRYPGKPCENPDVKERVIVPRLVPMYHVRRMIMLGAGPSHFLERSQPWNGPAPSGPQYTDPGQCAAPRTGSPGAFFLPCSLGPPSPDSARHCICRPRDHRSRPCSSARIGLAPTCTRTTQETRSHPHLLRARPTLVRWTLVVTRSATDEAG